MTQTKRRITFLAWLLAGAAILASIILVVDTLSKQPITGVMVFLEFVVFALLTPVLYSVLGAMIVSRQPGNTVGWLMLVSSQNLTVFLTWMVTSQVTIPAAPPEALTLGWWLLLWFDEWSWMLFIFPIFLIPLHFPNGRLPSPRWKWVNDLAAGLWLFLAGASMFADRIGPVDGIWTIPNPIGFISEEFFGETFLIFWGIGLMTVVGGSVASLFFRYRRAGFTEREQIKWLLLAGIVFFIGYGFNAVLFAIAEDVWGGPIFALSIVVIPVAIAIAILRHRLYDINLIIRRALQYSLMTGLLALVYFGGVVLMQGIFTSLMGESSDSPLITVISTLIFAALFTPLRRGTQWWIDRRFFRAKYDAEQVLEGFARTARDEVNLDQLASSLLEVVDRTVQPARASLWLRERHRG